MQYFRPIDVILIRKRIRDFAPADTTYLNPKASFVAPDGPYIDGEWFRIGADYKVERAYTAGAADFEETAPCWPFFAEQGRYDTQRTGMIPLIWEQIYEVKVYRHVYEGGVAWAVNQPFTVGTITDPDGIERAGIKAIDVPLLGAGLTGMIFGYVTEPPSAADEPMKVLVMPPAPATSIA